MVQISKIDIERAEQIAMLTARRYRLSMDKHNDYRSTALLTLVEKSKTYNPNVGTSLWQYASKYIEGAILHEIREQGALKRTKPSVDDMRPPEVRTPEELVFERQFHDLLLKAIDGLPPTMKRVVIGRFFKDKSITEFQGLSPEGVRQSLSKSMEYLRRSLIRASGEFREEVASWV
jgi:RNA polymerase sigma factor (sigma-70 family)